MDSKPGTERGMSGEVVTDSCTRRSSVLCVSHTVALGGNPGLFRVTAEVPQTIHIFLGKERQSSCGTPLSFYVLYQKFLNISVQGAFRFL